MRQLLTKYNLEERTAKFGGTIIPSLGNSSHLKTDHLMKIGN